MTFPDNMHAASMANLQPITSTEQARILGSKGGSSKTPAKSLAAKLRELKKKGVSDESVEWIHNTMVSDELSSYNILVLLRSMYAAANTSKERESIARLLIDFHKMRHGTKETKHTLDVTSKEYKFIIETQVVANAPEAAQAQIQAK